MGRQAQARSVVGRTSGLTQASAAGLLAGFLLVHAVLAHAQSLPFEPAHESGTSVTGAFEGWFKNPDGSFSLLLGYYNRNQKQELDIPVGPDNRIEPGGPDRGQPTHFLVGRQWGLFAVKVPSDFGENKLTWTIVANTARPWRSPPG